MNRSTPVDVKRSPESGVAFRSIYKTFGVRTLNRTRTGRRERVRPRPVQRLQYFLVNRTEPDFRITTCGEVVVITLQYL